MTKNSIKNTPKLKQKTEEEEDEERNRDEKRSMDRTRRHSSCQFRTTVWRQKMGFCSQSFRFEGGGRFIRNTYYIGLNRTGKSCRLRWVNYLHPGLKRGKMSPQEEKLILDLHSKWGNRWSKIARKLPGRTDNEIKNYWRTFMRKKAQEKKRAKSSSPSSSKSLSSSSTITTTTTHDSWNCTVDDLDTIILPEKKCEDETDVKTYSMDDIWNDIDLLEENSTKPVSYDFSLPPMTSPLSNYHPFDLTWEMEDEDYERKMFLASNKYFPYFE